MPTDDLVLFLRTLAPSTYGFTEQIRAGVLELQNRDVDEIVAYGGLDTLVTLLMENVGDGPLHLLGFQALIKVAEKYKHLVRLTAASQVAEQIMQIHDDEVVELGDVLIRMLYKKDSPTPLNDMHDELKAMRQDYLLICRELKLANSRLEA
jgi:hypothetical protein